MKEIQLSSIASRSLPSTYPEKLKRIAAEIDMIMSINHPNIVRYFGIEKYKVEFNFKKNKIFCFFIIKRTIYICMEYCLSTVNEFLNDIRTFQNRASSRKSNSNIWTDSSDQDDEINIENIRLAPSLNVNELVRGFVKQLLQALLALHEHYIVHCDVKGDNIFIANENGHYIVKLGVRLFLK
jgi:serine/threonine protein kinase